MPDVNSETRTIDEQMDWSFRGEPAKPNVTELLKPPRQRGVIGDREIDFEQFCEGTQEALGLAKRKMENHADRQRGLDRHVRVGTLTTGFPTGRGSPGIERSIRKPDGQVTTFPEGCLVFRPIP